MIGGKKDTPASRAALAKRRQRGVTKSGEAPSSHTTPFAGTLTTRTVSSSSNLGEVRHTSDSNEGKSESTLKDSQSFHTSYTLLSVPALERKEIIISSYASQSIVETEIQRGLATKATIVSVAAERVDMSEMELRDDEEDDIVEHPEPIAAHDVMDGSCLSCDSFVTIRPCISLSALAISDDNKAILTGIGLGHTRETFQITIVSKDPFDTMLRYGDIVAFYSPQNKRFLGIHPLSTDKTNGSKWNVSFASSGVGLGEQWTVLHGNRRLWVGPSALEHMSKEKRTSDKTTVVRSGEVVVMRNHLNGGILSIKSTEDVTGLFILTDTYDESYSKESAADRIQHHDRILPSDREGFQFLFSSIPPCPHWIGEKITSFCIIETRDWGQNHYKYTFSQPIDQERVLVEEMISSMMGLEGDLIKIVDEPKVAFVWDGNMPLTPSLRNLVDFVLPVSTSFIRIHRYLREHTPGYEFGKVVQALCQAVDEILQDYLREIFTISQEFRSSQLNGETPLTLNNLFIRVQQPRHTLSIVERVIVEAKTKKGGFLLNALRDLKLKMFVGDSRAQVMLRHLLDCSSVPYMEIMSAWLEKGILADPCREFMIERSDQSIVESKYDGDSWDGLFVIVTENVLNSVVSQRPLPEKILATGKYLNAVHFCETGALVGHFVPGDEQKVSETLTYNMDQVLLASSIDRLYKAAAINILRQILVSYDLPGTLRTLKRYFLLDHGDFFLNFLDDAEIELSKDASDVSWGRTQHWLSMAFQAAETSMEDSTSISTMYDPVLALQPLSSSLIRCVFAGGSLIAELDALYSTNDGIEQLETKTPSRQPYGAVNGLTAIMAFTLDFPVVEFPTSLFISERNLSKYKLLFRHLFFAKYVERRLVGIWSNHQTMKVLKDLHGSLRHTFCLRQRMLHLMQNLISYIMLEVIEPNWRVLITKICEQHQRASDISNYAETMTVDSLMELHNSFLDQSLEQCFLTNLIIVHSLTKLISTCFLFSEQMDRFMQATKIVSDFCEFSSFLCRHFSHSRNTKERGKRIRCEQKKKRNAAKFKHNWQNSDEQDSSAQNRDQRSRGTSPPCTEANG